MSPTRLNKPGPCGTAVVAVGGNSLITNSHHQDVNSQWAAVRETCAHVADMVERGWNMVLTHGNGPQVGFILRRNELAAGEVHTTPIDLIVADTQASIGYMIAQSLGNELRRRQCARPIVSVVTRVLVDRDDPAFAQPSKGIGGFTDEENARRFEREGWQVVEDAGRGWRRVIASPRPLRILELDAIRALVEGGRIVVAVGGGGIPVIEEEGGDLRGVMAVIDKDRAPSLLAQALQVDLFLISTSVSQVALNYRQPGQRWLARMTAAEARAYHAQGHFRPGSMGPKIEAVLDYLDAHPQGRAIITDPPNITRALDGQGGTWIVAGEES
jgi:carbamate kinase